MNKHKTETDFKNTENFWLPEGMGKVSEGD